ncbi:DUF3613 domain-containing protein [Paraburkholderia acidipaludis]|uniref:DUF3613 domain-containing protein n=1 Tax=Paraburkholderia acidipaludis TaxID=660537 RepID=UPI0005B8CD16|nr:DUF3613 domain-containing protein [Paraburkholderia acidipaludis]
MKTTNNDNENNGARGRLAALALCVLLAPQAHAQASDAVPNSEIGHSASAWLDLQRSNAQAAPALPMLGAEAGLAWRRYLKSFDTEIPVSFGSSVDTGQSQANMANAPAASGSPN